MKRRSVLTHALVGVVAATTGALVGTALASTTQDCHDYSAEGVTVCVSSTPSSSTTTAPPATTSTTRAPTTSTTVPPTTTTTTTLPPAPVPTVGAPADVGLTSPATSLKVWSGPTTITPTTGGVVGGNVTGYLFTSAVTVSGNVHFSNDKFSTQAERLVTIAGTATPGPTFSHIEIDGQNTLTTNDDIGITNSSRDNGGVQGVTVSPFTIDRSHIYNVVNGTRLDSGATVTNTLIDWLSTPPQAHTDGTEIYCGHGIVIDHTTINAGGNNTNAAIETQGGSGGFCPVSNVTFTNDLFSGGTATWRLDDNQITHVAMANVMIAGPPVRGVTPPTASIFFYFATSVVTASSIDSWSNVRLSSGTPVPSPATGVRQFGCGPAISCN